MSSVHTAPTQPERPEAADSLRMAASLVAGVMPRLNTAADVCAGCQRRHDLNFTDAELSRQLTRVIGDLKRFADILEHGQDLLVERKRKRDHKRGRH